MLNICSKAAQKKNQKLLMPSRILKGAFFPAEAAPGCWDYDLEDESLGSLPNLAQFSLGLQHFCSSSIFHDLIHSYEPNATMLLTRARLSPVSHLPVQSRSHSRQSLHQVER